MTYLQSHRKRPKARVPIFIAGAIIVLVGLVIYIFPHFFPSLFSSIAAPFWRAQFSILSGSLNSPAELLRQNEDLRRQLDEAETGLASTKFLEEENAELKSLMGRASSTPVFLAAVLKKPPIVSYDELVIDAGSDLGVSTSTLIYAPGEILIGRVSEVMPKTSKVVLFSSPGQKYDVLVGKDHIAAVAVGRGGGQYSTELPRDTEVSEGDYVLSPSLSDKPFGIITSVISDPAMPFETVLFAPISNIYQLRWVYFHE